MKVICLVTVFYLTYTNGQLPGLGDVTKAVKESKLAGKVTSLTGDVKDYSDYIVSLYYLK